MIIDKQNEFSVAQVLASGAAASTNTIDLGYAGADAGTGKTLFLVVQATADQGGTDPTLTVALQQSDAESSGFANVFSSPAYAAFDAGQSKVFPLPATSGRYLRLNYTVGGTATPTAAVSAFIVEGEQAYKAYADAIEAVPYND
jgi:hypothetical protein